VAAPPSGEQFEIRHGDQRATIVEVGGGIREFFAGERAVLEPFPPEAICDGGHGAVLLPWPNRIGDGRYSFDGAERQLALTEPGRRNAIHGLLRWVPWRALEHEPGRVLMGARLHPHPGYPFELEVSVEYRLGDDGLTVTTTTRNLGESACPYGTGQHPYLSPGEGTIDECVLEFGAATVITTDAERGLPTGRESLDGGELDFRRPRRLGAAVIDCPFTDLERGEDGMARARLTGTDGLTVELWVDSSHPVVELFTGDTLAPGRRRTGLAVEPMTCPPDAFRSGESLTRLEPGETFTSSWGAGLLRAW
jgi:aldose 1-epimerase